jgi:hypothetical protein
MENIKGKLEFNLEEPSSKLAFKRASNADNAYLALDAMWNELFRPAFKHGYSNKNLQELMDKSGTLIDKETGETINIGYEIVSKLSEIYREILIDNDVDTEDIY